MKINNKTLKLVLAILVIILVSIASFMGVYIVKKNNISNSLKEYKLGMDLSGSRKIKLDVSDEKETINYDENGNIIESSDTETEVATTEEKPVNAEEILTLSNYKETKNIIEKRLKTMGVDEYEIRLNESNGTIVVNIPEDDNTDLLVTQMQYKGKFEIIDSETKEVLMTNDDLKQVRAGYGTSSSTGSTSIYLSIEFNKEGTQKFKDITNTYIEEKTTDEETGEEKTNTKQITIQVDGSTILSTYFDQEISNGILQLSVGSSASGATTEELQESLNQANNMAALLDNGVLPITYTVDQNTYISTNITNINIAVLIIFTIVVLTIGMIYIIVKYKENGILVAISLVGYLAVLLLVIRYTNVIISVSGIVAMAISVVLNYVFGIQLLDNAEKIKNMKSAYGKTLKKYLLLILPVSVIAIVFVFNKWTNVASMGMVMFWGLMINILYNLVITRTLLTSYKD